MAFSTRFGSRSTRYQRNKRSMEAGMKDLGNKTSATRLLTKGSQSLRSRHRKPGGQDHLVFLLSPARCGRNQQTSCSTTPWSGSPWLGRPGLGVGCGSFVPSTLHGCCPPHPAPSRSQDTTLRTRVAWLPTLLYPSSPSDSAFSILYSLHGTGFGPFE